VAVLQVLHDFQVEVHVHLEVNVRIFKIFTNAENLAFLFKLLLFMPKVRIFNSNYCFLCQKFVIPYNFKINTKFLSITG
jgi:hypothetical protein